MEQNNADIIKFVKEWREKNHIADNVKLNDVNMTKFVTELQQKISEMDFSIPNNATIIAYSGRSNGEWAYKIVGTVTKEFSGEAFYISNLPAGELINTIKFRDALQSVIGNTNMDRVLSGYDENGKRMEGGSCGFGDLLSLDDFVSAKLIGETIGASNNVIVFTPERIDPTKVFATTEIEKIFKNNAFEYINGIPKEELKLIYESEGVGKQSVYDILTKIAKEVVGDVSVLEEQANCLVNAFSKEGDLSVEGSPYTLYGCYDIVGSFMGIELDSTKHEVPLIEQTGEVAFCVKIKELLRYTNELGIMDKLITYNKQGKEYLKEECAKINKNRNILNIYQHKLSGNFFIGQHKDDKIRVLGQQSKSLTQTKSNYLTYLKKAEQDISLQQRKVKHDKSRTLTL